MAKLVPKDCYLATTFVLSYKFGTFSAFERINCPNNLSSWNAQALIETMIMYTMYNVDIKNFKNFLFFLCSKILNEGITKLFSFIISFKDRRKK